MSFENMEDNQNSKEEEKIAKNLVKYLHKPDFTNRSLASIDRILELYYTHYYNKNASDEKEVISFLFKYLNDKNEHASILFRHIKNSSERNNIIKRLYKEHRWDFEFDIISSEIFLTSFSLIKLNEILKKILVFCAVFISFLLILSFTSHHQIKSIKLEHKEQLNANYILLQNERSAKEKLEDELKILKQNYEKEAKTKEQLGSEITSLKQNLQDEILTIKQHFEYELTTVKEKQQEANELSICKENLQQEKLNKIQIESELLTCKENFEKEQLDKEQIETELTTCREDLEREKLSKQQIELNSTESVNEALNLNKTKQTKKIFEFIRKINPYLLLYSLIDITVFVIVILCLILKGSKIIGKYFTLIPFVFEILLNFQFLYDGNSIYVYYCFTIIFVLSIVSVLLISTSNDLLDKYFLILPFVYTTIASTYKYSLIISKYNELTKLYLIFTIFSVLEFITIFVIKIKIDEIVLSLVFGIVVFIYYSCLENSPLFLSNASFVAVFICSLIITINESDVIEILGCVFLDILCLLKFLVLNFWKLNEKIYYIVITSVLIIEIILCFVFKNNDEFGFLFFLEILLSFLLLNFKVFTLFFISILFIFLLMLIAFLYVKNKRIPNDDGKKIIDRVFLMLIALSSIIQFIFSLIKAWKWYNIYNILKRLRH